MLIWAVDPGTTESAIVCYDSETSEILEAQILPNNEVLDLIGNVAAPMGDVLVIEGFTSYGAKVGQTVFEAIRWSGRFEQVWTGWTHKPARYEPRVGVKRWVCGTPRSKDGDVRRALILRLGEVGTKKKPGPLYGIKSHMWAALAVAVTYGDQHGGSKRIKT